MDNNHIAVEKHKLYKLINVKKYDQAKSYLYSQQNNIFQMALDRLKPYLDAGLIHEEEVDTFIQIIEKNIINNMLSSNDYVRMNSFELFEIIEKRKKLEKMKKLTRC